VLFAGDTNALIISNNLNELQTKLVCTLTYMSEYFTANGLKLHIDKTNKMHFKLNFSSNSTFQVSYCEINVKQAVHKKFLGFDFDNHMNWETQIDKIIPILSKTCYVLRSVYFFKDVSTFKTIYYAYFHSVMEYGIIFWCKSSSSKKVLQVQKKKNYMNNDRVTNHSIK